MSDEAARAVETVIDTGDGGLGSLRPATPTLIVAGRGEDGSYSKGALALPDNSAMEELHALIQDPGSDPAEVSRKITTQLSLLVKEQMAQRANQFAHQEASFKTCAELIKSLKELRTSLLDTESLSKRDSLNLKGAKAQLLIGRMVEWFVQALREAGVMEDFKNNIMQQFRDISKAGEPALEREIAQLGQGRK
jgi:hypothetical protein